MAGAPTDLPREGDILAGTIVRIESYGAFCRLDTSGQRPLQGLIHISQLIAGQRVERVDDVISVDDRVWVKVLNVEMDPSSQRWRIQLSRKDVSQDGLGTDLGLERETRDREQNHLKSNLNSMIGMGVARDPMEDRLTMKHNKNMNSVTYRGGYSLVGENEGEQEPATAVEAPAATTRQAPMGRGRGTTLPAWMTQAPADGPTGSAKREDEKSIDSNDEDIGRKRKKKQKKKHLKSHRKHRRKHSSKDRKQKRSGSERDGNVGSDSASEHTRVDEDPRSDRKKRRKTSPHNEEPPSSEGIRGKRESKRTKQSRPSHEDYHGSGSEHSRRSSSRPRRSRRRSRSRS